MSKIPYIALNETKARLRFQALKAGTPELKRIVNSDRISFINACFRKNRAQIPSTTDDQDLANVVNDWFLLKTGILSRVFPSVKCWRFR